MSLEGAVTAPVLVQPDYVRLLARYNLWQNRSLLAAADSLEDAARVADRGAFFRSIAGTLSHLLWGDLIWMSRFDGGEKPAGGIAGSDGLFTDWAGYKAVRVGTDLRIIEWAEQLQPDDLSGDLIWFSAALGQTVTRPKGLLVAHMFNHQTHHRGQVHAMLTAAGTRPGDTDLFIMPDLVS